ncbi:hypothetical protein AB0F18_14450 [Streptomyces sp. NPDC029216]|uniref:hypothetical protein n=1 Tax=Streptomyces sp. NPDC029216 TaxID=3154701 RepID=UPI0033E7D5ED
MSTDPLPGSSALIYVEDVTPADVEGLEVFLRARVARSAAAERGSDKRQVARSVGSALDVLAGNLTHWLQYDPDALTPQEAANVRGMIRTGWSALTALASPWAGHADYDRARWRSAKNWDAGEAAEWQRRLEAAARQVPVQRWGAAHRHGGMSSWSSLLGKLPDSLEVLENMALPT